MIAIRPYRLIARLTFMLALFGCQRVSGAASNLGDVAPSGVWDIVAVDIDQQSTRTSTTRINDVRDIGRSYTFTVDRVSSTVSGGATECVRAKFSPVSGRVGDLFQQAFGPVSDTAPARPEDYRLPLTSSSVATGFWIDCAGSAGGPATRWGLLLKLPNGGYLLPRQSEDGQVFTLRKRTPDAKPNPSFPCARATSAMEKAICASVDLSAMDRGLAKAYAARMTSKAGAASLQSSQRRWIAKAATCGADTACIEKAISDRTAELADPAATED